MINKFRAYDNQFALNFDIQLEPQQNIYCFIGENGVGKTKLLQTMAKVLISSHDIFTSKKHMINAGQINNNLASSFYESVGHLGINLPKEISINNYSISLGDDNSFKIRIYNSGLFGYNFSLNIPIVFISAKGRGYIAGINSSEGVKFPGNFSNEFTAGFFRTYYAIHDLDISDNGVTDWFLQRLVINPNLVAGAAKFHNEAIYVLECLQSLEPSLQLVDKKPDGATYINFALVNGDIVINNIPIQFLSTGYASILRIIQEIVSGINSWQPNSDFKTSEAIVFIDEIDLHLHPIWQYKIIDILKQFFPKVTFYITTHSPLILFGVKNGESYKLIKDKNNLVTADKIVQTNMHFIADILQEFFDTNVSSRKIDKEAMLKARAELLKLLDETPE